MSNFKPGPLSEAQVKGLLRYIDELRRVYQRLYAEGYRYDCGTLIPPNHGDDQSQ